MKRFLSLILLMSAVPLFAEDKPFFFQKGDRVTFLGDSITAQYQYSSDIELYLTTRFPDWKLSFLNAGIGGDTANGGAGRFQNSVLDDKPTAITINFGMNDAGYGKFNPAGNKLYVEKTEAMVRMAKKAGARVALVSPNAVDRRKNKNFDLYLETQKQFYAPLKDIATKEGVSFADQYSTTRTAVEKMETDKAEKVVPYYDGFHTASPGGLLMAHAILTGLNAPAKVTSASIDAAGKKSVTERCKIENLAVTAESVTFDRTDEAIPFPVQPDWVTILPYVNNLKDLNDYNLTVTGLAAGKWSILIDGKPVTTATAEELAAGVNLGLATSGPMFDQGKKVLDAINAKNKLVADRFFNVILYNPPQWLAGATKELRPGELQKRLGLIAEQQDKIYEMLKPMPHKFEVKIVK
ncbi:SGNH/GDSL hydrolase family protein [Zavarzinella formosa]|uniref:SGNH/GDSL hydrolase family protein n=1 Tax=Zavarzinella formosa TaxID=360055 RepID=UPI0002E548D2|nr:SGNH/GDSL hydrolase family protein [Zavarzinella formosa]